MWTTAWSDLREKCQLDNIPSVKEIADDKRAVESWCDTNTAS